MVKLIIDIPEDTYNRMIAFDGVIDDYWLEAIKNGTPLPKGHGRLIDADKLQKYIDDVKRAAFTRHDVWLMTSVYNKKVPTIIEADKEERE